MALTNNMLKYIVLKNEHPEWTELQLAAEIGVDDRQLRRWKHNDEFKDALALRSLLHLLHVTPQVVQALIANALRPEGIKDRETLFKKVLPMTILMHEKGMFNSVLAPNDATQLQDSDVYGVLAGLPSDIQPYLVQALTQLGYLQQQRQTEAEQTEGEDQGTASRYDSTVIDATVVALPAPATTPGDTTATTATTKRYNSGTAKDKFRKQRKGPSYL